MARASQSSDVTSSIRIPGPDDDATPFVLRCYVKRGPFRPLYEFEPDQRPLYDEFKLYLWRTATLRDVATFLHIRNRSLASPLALYDFRIVRFDERAQRFDARPAGEGVTRISKSTFQSVVEKELSEVLVGRAPDRSHFHSAMKSSIPSFPERADEKSSLTRLDEIGFRDDDELMDCIIWEPTSSTAERHGGGKYQEHKQRSSADERLRQPFERQYNDKRSRTEANRRRGSSNGGEQIRSQGAYRDAYKDHDSYKWRRDEHSGYGSQNRSP